MDTNWIHIEIRRSHWAKGALKQKLTAGVFSITLVQEKRKATTQPSLLLRSKYKYSKNIDDIRSYGQRFHVVLLG